MKISLLAFFLMVFLGAAPSAFAADDDGRGIQFFGTVDYYAAGDIDEEVEDDYNALIDLVGNGSSDITTSNGVGGRLGVRTTLAEGAFDLGVSAGYVMGPEIEATFESFSPVARTEQTIQTEFIRAMVEAGGRIWFGENVALRLGVGAGVGQSKMTDDFSVTAVGSRSREEKSTGATWELSPALLIRAGKADVEIGARYAQFPKIKKTDDTYEIDWTTLGFYAGVAF